MSLTVIQLFVPASSGVGAFGAVPTVPAQGTWLSIELQIAQTITLPTTSWQVGDPERTIFATEAVCFSLSDANISQMAQGGFLQSAASGTVFRITCWRFWGWRQRAYRTGRTWRSPKPPT